MTILTVKTAAALAWVNENTHFESWQIMGASIACDYRMGMAIKEAMIEDGLRLGVDFT